MHPSRSTGVKKKFQTLMKKEKEIAAILNLLTTRLTNEGIGEQRNCNLLCECAVARYPKFRFEPKDFSP